MRTAFTRYIRWIVPLLVLTLLIVSMVIFSGFGASAAGSKIKRPVPVVNATVTPTPTPDDGGIMQFIFWRP